MKKHYIAFTASNLVSQKCETKVQAEEWAARQIGVKNLATEISIYELVSVVQAEVPPVKVTNVE